MTAKTSVGFGESRTITVDIPSIEKGTCIYKSHTVGKHGKLRHHLHTCRYTRKAITARRGHTLCDNNMRTGFFGDTSGCSFYCVEDQTQQAQEEKVCS